MRHSFSDGATLRARAQASVNDGSAHLRRWWSRKYKLPPNHQLFLDRSRTSLHEEMCEDLLIRRDELEKEIYEDGDKGGHLMAELTKIISALGDAPFVYDPLWDKWEAELAEGKMPDLDEVWDENA